MKIEIFKRKDKKWSWRVRAANGQILATDGHQGYENLGDARHTAETVTANQLVVHLLDEDNV